MTTWRGYTITQPFGVPNPDYRLKYHPGTDLRFALGTHQPAFAAGTARYHRDTGDGYGHTGTITLPNGDVIFYAHLKTNGILVTTGTRVEEMQPVFVTGSSGWVQLVHAHVEYRIGGNKNNPVDITKKLGEVDNDMKIDKELAIKLERFITLEHSPDPAKIQAAIGKDIDAYLDDRYNDTDFVNNKKIVRGKYPEALQRIKDLEAQAGATFKPVGQEVYIKEK